MSSSGNVEPWQDGDLFSFLPSVDVRVYEIGTQGCQLGQQKLLLGFTIRFESERSERKVLPVNSLSCPLVLPRPHFTMSSFFEPDLKSPIKDQESR